MKNKVMTREEEIKQAVTDYIGYPKEVDEDISISFQRAAFADGANWQYHKSIKKTCKWLEDFAELTGIDFETIKESFMKAMEE